MGQRLKEKNILVTASTRGIGLAIVRKCAQEGTNIYMAARNMKRTQEVADKLNNEGYTVKCVYNDAIASGGFGLATPVYGDLANRANRR